MLSCIVLYCIVLYCIVLYCIVLYCIALYCVVLYCLVLHCIVLYCIVLYCIVLYYVFLMIFLVLLQRICCLSSPEIFRTLRNLVLICYFNFYRCIYNKIDGKLIWRLKEINQKPLKLMLWKKRILKFKFPSPHQGQY